MYTGSIHTANTCITLQWRYNERDVISNHQRLDCLLKRLFRRSSKKISKLHVTGLCEGNPPVPGGFPSQRVSNTENVPLWWHHNDSHYWLDHRSGKTWPCHFISKFNRERCPGGHHLDYNLVAPPFSVQLLWQSDTWKWNLRVHNF